MDSHGKFLDPIWMYQNKQLRIPVLCAGKTNIRGAIEQIQKEKSPKHFIIRVGCNDLSNENPEDVALKLKINGIGKTPKIHLTYLPKFERCGDRAWNQITSVTNRKLENIFEESLKLTKYLQKVLKLHKGRCTF